MARAGQDRIQDHAASNGVGLLHSAEGLGANLPGLMTNASRVAHTVAQGLHGRRRAGLGETFWQFRSYRPGDTVAMIDWRKSARTERLYVREREWEAANTIWFWVNPTASMAFRSNLARETKLERALLLSLAAASLLIRGGERIGAFASGMRASTNQHALRRLGDFLIGETTNDNAGSLPAPVALARFSNVVLFSDFFEPIDAIASRLTAIASRDVHGHLVQVVDPAEETLPYKGRTHFLSMRKDISVTFGRAEDLRIEYRRNFEAHRDALRQLARRVGWTFGVHRTDTAPQLALLSLYRLLADAIEPHRTHVRSKRSIFG